MDLDDLPQLMVTIGQVRSVDGVLRSIVTGLAQDRSVVLARIWLAGPGDLCGSCQFRADCPDQTRCLHLVASAGNARSDRTDYSRLTGTFGRIPIGYRKVGLVAKDRVGRLVVSPDTEWAEPAWVQREQVEAFAAQPLIFEGDLLGVLGVFDRKRLDQEHLRWLRIFADHAAGTIATARAFEELETLRRRLEGENEYLQDEVRAAAGKHGLLGDSPAMGHLIRQIELVAPTDAPVLILGESGTGKELVGQAIHDRSHRRLRSLIKVNCNAIPGELFESEFFGHVKGAFTGAAKDRLGRFQLADGGSLFLDEIGEVPTHLQAKLLRAVQDGSIERVGEDRARRVNTRVIAATNRNLAREVEAGRFRLDLYYRLSVFPIHVPPLRDRRDDIALLARHFVRLATHRLGRPRLRLRPDQVAQLRTYDWPGNVRELQNVVERAVILADARGLHLELGTGANPGAARSRAVSDGILTRPELKRLERESISLALERTDGKLFGTGGAAELLGMKPTTLASRLRALKLTRRRPP
jgi:transcriptional regulator with GAF, ATPase, and Fis domain